MTGATETPTVEQRLVFSADGTVASYAGDSLVSRRRFAIGRDRSIFTGDTADVVRMDDMISVIDLAGDTLHLSQNCPDCWSSTYVRVK